MTGNPQIAKWDARYAARAPADEPLPLLPAAVAGVRPGRALDLACGAGRHAVWLARRGWRVDAVDGSAAGIELLLASAARAGCRDRIRPRVADLETDPPGFTIAEAAYDLIVDCCFLHRPLLARIRRGVRPGGLFVAALHTRPAAGGRGHGYVVAPGELRRLAAGWGWTILHDAERAPAGGAGHDGLGVAELVARRPARPRAAPTLSRGRS